MLSNWSKSFRKRRVLSCNKRFCNFVANESQFEFDPFLPKKHSNLFSLIFELSGRRRKLEMTDRKRMKCWISSFNLFWSIFRTCWYRSVHSCEVTGSDPAPTDPSIWTDFLLNLFSVCILWITLHNLSTSPVYQGLLLN